MSELSKNEIRIGNYLISKMMGILQVQMIPVDIDMSNYKPIPITEQWLVSFGFYYSDDDNDFLELKPFRTFKFYADYSNCFSTVAFRINDTEREINFVHQLQNLYFALTGKELTHQKIN